MLRKPFRLGPGAVVDHEFVARLQKVARHGRAHDPQPHESHLLLHPLSLSAKPTRSKRLSVLRCPRRRTAASQATVAARSAMPSTAAALGTGSGGAGGSHATPRSSKRAGSPTQRPCSGVAKLSAKAASSVAR